MEKKPIVASLRDMDVGDRVIFPITQYNSVRTSIYTSLVADRAEGKEWEIKLDIPNKVVDVKRIS